MSTAVPMVDFLELEGPDAPRLMGQRCGGCGAVFVDVRQHCAACGDRDGLVPAALGRSGQVHAYTIVHRSFPGIPVPYVSAVVDLEGGGTLKGNLVGVDPAQVRVGLQVQTIFIEAHSLDAEGRTVITYAFEPARGAP